MSIFIVTYLFFFRILLNVYILTRQWKSKKYTGRNVKQRVRNEYEKKKNARKPTGNSGEDFGKFTNSEVFPRNFWENTFSFTEILKK